MNNNLAKLAHILEKKNRFLITSHLFPDGDSVGSQVALALVLKENLCKEVFIINPHPLPERYSFIKGSEMISHNFSIEDLKRRDFEVGIILDCNSWDRLGKIKKIADFIPFFINIDHHPDNIRGIGSYNYIDPEASAVAEILYFLFYDYLKIEFSYYVALALYVGILTDTGSFRQPNTTPQAHMVAAKLLSYKINPATVSNYVYQVEEYETLKLRGVVLSNIQVHEILPFGWTYVCQSDLERIGIKDFESESVIAQLRSLKGVKIIALFRELPSSSVKVSLRSLSSSYEVNRIAAKFGGGGHAQAAGCIINLSLSQAIEEVKRAVEEYL